MYAPRDHFSRIFLPSVAVSHGRRIVVPAKIAICEEPCEDLLLEWHATAQINATTERALWHGSNAGIHRHDRAVANGLAQDAQTEPARISPTYITTPVAAFLLPQKLNHPTLTHPLSQPRFPADRS
jgi:hypothetical protein